MFTVKNHYVLFCATWFLRVSFASATEDQNFSANKNFRHPLRYVQAYKLLI